ncbi:MAG: hypothetical protein LRY40_07445, partial [Shewanella fodinae]|nr:hypothetical protein [Shewanella fodinae]
GFESELEKRLLGVVPQGELLSAGQPIANWRQMLSDASAIHGITAAAPMVKMQGLVQKPGGFAGVQVVGIDPALEQHVSTLGNYLSPGWQSLQGDGNHIVMGQGLLKKTRAESRRFGDALSASSPWYWCGDGYWSSSQSYLGDQR